MSVVEGEPETNFESTTNGIVIQHYVFSEKNSVAYLVSAIKGTIKNWSKATQKKLIRKIETTSPDMIAQILALWNSFDEESLFGGIVKNGLERSIK